MYLENFPEKLKKIRLSSNLTQSDLANILETTKQAVSSYESGKVKPSLNALIRLSEHFNISIDSLVFDKESNNNIDFTSNLTVNNELKLEIKTLLNTQNKINELFSYLLKETMKIPMCLSEIDDRITKLNNFISDIDSDRYSTNFKIDDAINKEIVNEVHPNIIKFKNKEKNIIDYRTIPHIGKVSAGNPCYAYEEIIDTFDIPSNKLCPNKEYFILKINGDSMNKLFNDGELILVEQGNIVDDNDLVVAIIGDDATFKNIKLKSIEIDLIPQSNNDIHKVQTYRCEDVNILGKVLGRLSDFIDS